MMKQLLNKSPEVLHPFHIMYRGSRTNHLYGISNCGRMVKRTIFTNEDDIAKIVGICKHCQRGPTKFVVKTDPRRKEGNEC